MNKLSTLGVTCLTALTINLPANAAQTMGNMELTSNYIWRGQSQTDNKPALQGGINTVSKSGVYAGFWMSNTDLGESLDTIEYRSSYEFDTYIGYSTTVHNIRYDVGVIHYYYDRPESTLSRDLTESYLTMSVGGFKASLFYNIHAGKAYSVKDNAYARFEYDFAIFKNSTATIHIGKNYGELTKLINGQQYTDVGFQISNSGFSFGISDTNLPESRPKIFASYAIEFDL